MTMPDFMIACPWVDLERLQPLFIAFRLIELQISHRQRHK